MINGRKDRRFERRTREGSVLEARRLKASFKGKILTLSSLSFLKFIIIYYTWIYYFEIYMVCGYLVNGLVYWVRMVEEKVSSMKRPKVVLKSLRPWNL